VTGIGAQAVMEIGGEPAPSHHCLACGARLDRLFVDLGMSPPCEDWLTVERLSMAETFYPLDVRICDACLLVQLPPYIPAEEIFTEYLYFSSYSDSWVEHARRFVDVAIERAGLMPGDRVIEVASNDGYLLQHVIGRGLDVLGIEPARNIAEVAIAKGIPTRNAFFGRDLATELVAERGPAALVVANNVFAHVPDINDFTAGLATTLARRGLMSIEVAYLARLIEGNEFDTIYHEHFFYYTVHSARSVLARHGLRLLDVEELPTHGGSIRLWVVHDEDPRPTSDSVETLLQAERAAGYDRPDGYGGFRPRVERTKRELLSFLIDERRRGARIIGYGAPGKANTLLNFCGIRTDLIDFIVDRNPHKHGRFTPGTHIPILPPERLVEARPDVILLLPWNLRDEIARQLADAQRWGARLVVPIPDVEVVPWPEAIAR
jgi:hypothetical protein